MTLSARPSAILSAFAFSLLALLSLSALAQAPAGARPNLLTNSNFEKGVEGWSVQPNSKIGTGVMDESEKRDGKPVFRITNSKGDDTLVMQKVTVKPQTRYRMTGYIKTKDIVPDNKRDKTGASLAIKGGFESTEMIQKTKPWSKVSLDFESGNKTEIEVGPRLGQYSSLVSGTAWFAELTLTELGRARK
jgi:hypothetical protein